jgi:predicted AAA+ superfamily ATPase
LIQVRWDIEDPDTKKRGLTGLLEGMRKFKLNQGLVITEDLEGRRLLRTRR